MIDIHSHILYGLDDGSETIDITKTMLETAVRDQITGIIATPHAYHPSFTTDLNALKEKIKVVNKWISDQGMPIKVYSGQECRFSEKLPERLAKGEVLTLAESKYILVELPSSGVPAYTVPIIQQLIINNFIPIIAHPERNLGIIENPERLRKLLLHGALAQITAGSIVGNFGKVIQRTAIDLIDSNFIHFYGSDIHNLSTRPFLYKEGLLYLEKKKRYEIINIMLNNNSKILSNEDFIPLEPQTITKSKWWGVLLSK